MPLDATANLSSAPAVVRTATVAVPAQPARPGPPCEDRAARHDARSCDEHRRLSVAVLVDLQRDHLAGGHVKCWERFAEAAVTVDEVDLTLYVLGRRGRVENLAPNVRFVSLAPVLSTRLVTGLVGGVDNSDLAPYSPALARRLPRHDVWHATHSLAFAATAVRLARTVPRAMVASVHTDVPMLTEVYTQQLVDRLGRGPTGRLLRRAGVVDRAVAATRRRRDSILAASAHVLVSNAADWADVAEVVDPQRISLLRRGVDLSRFRPDPGARAYLQRRHGVPTGRRLILFAGRVDATKGVMVLAHAVRRMLRAGSSAHLVLVGDGAHTDLVRATLGSDVSVLGSLPQPELARVYPGCDVLAFPSVSDTAGNVVVEAMASGLPVLLARGSRTNGWLTDPGQDGLLVDGSRPESWARELAQLLADAPRRERMSQRAMNTVRTAHPSWREVLVGDLLPVWRRAANRHGRSPSWARSPVESRPVGLQPDRWLSSPVGG